VSATEKTTDDKRQLLRHTVATLAYRGGKAVSSIPDSFASFRLNETTRTPIQILTHIGDLFDWALSIAQGRETWNNAKLQSWDAEVERFFVVIKAFDDYLASDNELACSAENLFQGPIADALTHVGQINLLRRMAGGPIKGENYFVAEIESGRVGADQSQKRTEF
jgi:hypothetical protein